MDSSFKGLLLECDVPEETVKKIGEKYKPHIFHSCFKSEAILDLHINKMLEDAEDWDTDPTAGAIRSMGHDRPSPTDGRDTVPCRDKCWIFDGGFAN